MKNTPPATPLRDDKQVTLAVDPTANALSVQQLLGQVQLIQQIMAATMKEGEHFGKIPGCGDKPTLLKPGAEKLCLTFRMAPAYQVDERQLDRAHREYRVQCTLTSILTGQFIGQGVGTCSSMEGKYRYRGVMAEATDAPVPRAYWDLRQEDPAKAQELLGGKGFSTKKVEGKGWMIAKGGEKAENDNPADTYNTVLKMAKKRALVDAVLTATAASDIFTQDLEDISANLAAATPSAAPVTPAVAPEPAVAVVKPSNGSGKSRRTPVRDIEAVSNHATDVEEAPASRVTETATAVAPGTDEAQPNEAAITDWRNARVHFGKNRGLLLSELSNNQVHWYETEWMPKKEANGVISQDDLALIDALKAHQAWREGQDSDAEFDSAEAAAAF